MRMQDTDQVVLKIEPKDSKGNAAQVEAGSVVLTPSDPNVLRIVPGADETHPIVQAIGPVGSASIEVSADADLGEGVKTITETTETVDVISGPASSLGLGFGTPEPQPPV